MNLGDNFLENIVVDPQNKKRNISFDDAQNWQYGMVGRLMRFGISTPPSFEYRFVVLILFVIITLLVLTARLFNLQIIEGDKNFYFSEENRIRVKRVTPERGVIYSSDGELLASNSPGFRVGIHLNLIENEEEVVTSLSKVLNMDRDGVALKIEDAIESGFNEAIIKHGVDRETVIEIETDPAFSKAVYSELDAIREYPQKEMMGHLIGYVAEISKEELAEDKSRTYVPGDTIGKVGLENFYEEFLLGEFGKQLFETDADGILKREIASKEKIDGLNVHTHLDLSLQKVSYLALEDMINKSEAIAGVVIVQDVNTGGILALANYPSFDPGIFSGTVNEEEYLKLSNNPYQPFFNRAISGVYPPASTFKIVTATAALEEGVVDETTQIEEVQTLHIGEFSFSNWTLYKGVGTHGLLSLTGALAYSSDIYFYEVGGGYKSQPGIGEEALSKWARAFGLGEVLGIDIPGESQGLVPNKKYKKETKNEDWYLGDDYITAIGQGDLLATPLQVSSYTSTIANGGKVLQPQIVLKVMDTDGKVALHNFPKVLGTVSSGPVLDLVAKGLREAVIYGTASSLQNFPVEIAGKTGTAETPNDDMSHAWFTAYAPYTAPEIAVTVFLENGGEGSDNAIPVARKVFEEYFKIK